MDGLDILKLLRLDGRVAVVTGGASGLGAVACNVLRQAGASVVCGFREGGRSKPDELFRRWGDDRFQALPLDVTIDESIEKFTDEIVRRMGRIDILVNSAAVVGKVPALQHPSGLWNRILATNLTGLFRMCKSVGRYMVEEGRGSIVNFSSIGGLVGYPGSSGYQASKGGVVQLTRSLAIEWAGHGVRVNGIAPSRFDTPLAQQVSEEDPDAPAFFKSRTPLKGSGEPRDIAGPVLFLASDLSLMVTGQTLPVDGGYTAQ